MPIVVFGSRLGTRQPSLTESRVGTYLPCCGIIYSAIAIVESARQVFRAQVIRTAESVPQASGLHHLRKEQREVLCSPRLSRRSSCRNVIRHVWGLLYGQATCREYIICTTTSFRENLSMKADPTVIDLFLCPGSAGRTEHSTRLRRDVQAAKQITSYTGSHVV